MQHHRGVPVPGGVLVAVACILEVDVGGHGECSPGGFVLGQAAGQQGVEVGVGFVPCTGGLVQFVGHVIADGFLSAVGSPLAVAVVVVNITASLGIDLFRVTHLEAQDVFVEVVVKGGGVHLNGVVSGIGVVWHTLSGTAQLLQSLGIIFQQFTYAVILGAIGFPVVVQNVVVVSSVTLIFHVRLQCIPDIRGHQSIAGVGKGANVIVLFNLLAVFGLFVGKGGSVFVVDQNGLSILSGLNITLAEAAVVMIAGFYIIFTVDQFHLGTGRHIGSSDLSGQVALRIKELVLILIVAVFLQRSIHQILHAAGRSVFIVLQLKVRIASIFLRQLLSVKAGDASFVGIAHVRGGNSQAAFLVHISVLGTVGQRHIKRRDAAGLFVMACFAGAGIVNELRAVREGAGERHPVVKIVIVLLFGFIGLQVLFHGLLAVGVDDFLHLSSMVWSPLASSLMLKVTLKWPVSGS